MKKTRNLRFFVIFDENLQKSLVILLRFTCIFTVKDKTEQNENPQSQNCYIFYRKSVSKMTHFLIISFK